MISVMLHGKWHRGRRIRYGDRTGRAVVLVVLWCRIYGTCWTPWGWCTKVDASTGVEVMLILVSTAGRGCAGGNHRVHPLCFGLLCGSGGRRLCNRQRHASKLSAAGYSHTPCESGAVSRAFFANLDTLTTVGAASIALYLPLLASKAVVSGSSSGCSSSSFPRSSGGIVCRGGGGSGGSGSGGVHFLSLYRLGGWRDGHGGWYKRRGVIAVLDSVASAGCMWSVYSRCINRIDKKTRGNTQWSIEEARHGG
jgi:uncharacterized membrane protein YgcG